MIIKDSLFRIHKNFKTIKNVIGRMEQRPPNFLTYLFGVTKGVNTGRGTGYKTKDAFSVGV